MKKYFLQLQELLLSKLLLIGIPLLILGGMLIYWGYQARQHTRPAATATGEPTQSAGRSLPSTPQTNPTARPNSTIRLAWFYKPPEEDQLDLVAQNFDFFILTYRMKTSGSN